MNWKLQNHPSFRESLYLTNGTVELIIPLEYGIRIGHFALSGGENVFFEQPQSMQELTTPEGWRIRGGHRLWLAPECDHDVYYPDNDPIRFEILDNGVLLTQKEDPRLHVTKNMQLTFLGGGKVEVVHRIVNTGKEALHCAIWAVSAMAPGGVQCIPLKTYDGGAMPRHWISMWSYTDLGDPRAHYSREKIVLTHLPMEQRYKIGIDRPNGPVSYENNGVVFEKSFPSPVENACTDKDVAYETLMCRHMVEMESLSARMQILPEESRDHTEIWHLRKTV